MFPECPDTDEVHRRREALRTKHQQEVVQFKQFADTRRTTLNQRLEVFARTEWTTLNERLRQQQKELQARHLQEERQFWKRESDMPNSQLRPLPTAPSAAAQCGRNDTSRVHDPGPPYPRLPPVGQLAPLPSFQPRLSHSRPSSNADPSPCGPEFGRSSSSISTPLAMSDIHGSFPIRSPGHPNQQHEVSLGHQHSAVQSYPEVPGLVTNYVSSALGPVPHSTLSHPLVATMISDFNASQSTLVTTTTPIPTAQPTVIDLTCDDNTNGTSPPSQNREPCTPSALVKVKHEYARLNSVETQGVHESHWKEQSDGHHDPRDSATPNSGSHATVAGPPIPLPSTLTADSCDSSAPKSTTEAMTATLSVSSEDISPLGMDNLPSTEKSPQQADMVQSDKSNEQICHRQRLLSSQYPNAQLLSPALSTRSRAWTPGFPLASPAPSPSLDGPRSPVKIVKRKEVVLSDDEEDEDWELSETESPLGDKSAKTSKDGKRPTKKARVTYGQKPKVTPLSSMPPPKTPKKNKLGIRGKTPKPTPEKPITPPRSTCKNASTPSTPSKPVKQKSSMPKTPTTPTRNGSKARAALAKSRTKSKSASGTKIDAAEVEELRFPVIESGKRKTAITAESRTRNLFQTQSLLEEDLEDSMASEEEEAEATVEKLPESIRRMSIEPGLPTTYHHEQRTTGLSAAAPLGSGVRLKTPISSVQNSVDRTHNSQRAASASASDGELDLREYDFVNNIIIRKGNVEEIDLTSE